MKYTKCCIIAMAGLFVWGSATLARNPNEMRREKESFAEIDVVVSFGPPELPIYEQPFCPGDGYIWTPGYWAWDGAEYYWVPGTWILAPEVGFLWTPPW